MHKECKRSCGVCPTDRPPPVPPAAAKPAAAKPAKPAAAKPAAAKPAAAKQAAQGGAAGSVCEDKDKNCAQWAADRQCASNPKFMATKCAKACGICVACDDKEVWHPV